MIKNAREYQITKAQAARFERALENPPDPLDSLELAQISRDATRSQLSDLRAELEEYDALEGGRVKILEVEDLDELPNALIRARIAAKLSQRELAERLGLKEQQIQRYEATDYASASLTRVLDVARALGLRLRQDVALPSLDISATAIAERLSSLGFDRKFIRSRLLVQNDNQAAWRNANAVARMLGLSAAGFMSDAPDMRRAAASAAFKMPGNASESKLLAYATYARYLAERTLMGTPALAIKALPSQPRECHEALVRDYGSISFEAALRYVWAHGIPVLPLQDSGAFHGAFWKIGGRSIIVLKQRASYSARWLVDLLHEFYHAIRAQDLPNVEVIEEYESPYERRGSEEETTATAWATAVALGEREDELAQACVDEAAGQVPRLRNAVVNVARRENVPVDVLANYLAYKLATHKQADWWGAAANLQATEVSPWTLARDILLEHIELHRLDRIDRDLLTRALTEEEN